MIKNNNKKQIVVLDTHKSSTTNMAAGLPQGSRLGPLISILYIYDIIEYFESDVLIFAINSSLSASDTDPNITAQILY